MPTPTGKVRVLAPVRSHTFPLAEITREPDGYEFTLQLGLPNRLRIAVAILSSFAFAQRELCALSLVNRVHRTAALDACNMRRAD